MKVQVGKFTSNQGEPLLYLGGLSWHLAFALLCFSFPAWVRPENKDRVIAILRLNGFEVEDHT